jgi:hypothetical protein
MRMSILGTALVLASVGHQAAQASIIYDATGGTENGGDPVAAAGPILADRFFAPANLSLNSITLNLGLADAASGSVRVDIFASTPAGPGAVFGEFGVVQDSSLAPGFALLTIASPQPILLAGGSYYYAGIQSAQSGAQLGNTLDSAVLARNSVAAGGVYYNNGGVQANAGGPYELSLSDGPATVPEPATSMSLLAGLAGLGIIARRRNH